MKALTQKENSSIIVTYILYISNKKKTEISKIRFKNLAIFKGKKNNN